MHTYGFRSRPPRYVIHRVVVPPPSPNHQSPNTPPPPFLYRIAHRSLISRYGCWPLSVGRLRLPAWPLLAPGPPSSRQCPVLYIFAVSTACMTLNNTLRPQGPLRYLELHQAQPFRLYRGRNCLQITQSPHPARFTAARQCQTFLDHHPARKVFGTPSPMTTQTLIICTRRHMSSYRDRAESLSTTPRATCPSCARNTRNRQNHSVKTALLLH